MIQWYKYESDIPTGPAGKFIGGTLQNPSLTITDFQLDDQGIYKCSVSNSYGTRNSSDIILYLNGGNGVFKYIESIFSNTSSKTYDELTLRKYLITFI